MGQDQAVAGGHRRLNSRGSAFVHNLRYNALILWKFYTESRDFKGWGRKFFELAEPVGKAAGCGIFPL
jgi:hypothetical protein